MRALLSKLRKRLVKREVIDAFYIDGKQYQVIDYRSIEPWFKNTRGLSFEKDGILYTHSSIFLNPKHHIQPVLPIPQIILSFWGEKFPINYALVLGCAGCSVPRFLALHYPKSKTIGVELSEELIHIAKKYFMLDKIEQQFELVQGDAFRFVEEHEFKEKQNAIFIDVFSDTKVIPEVYSESFIRGLFDCADEECIILFNLFDEEPSKILSFANRLEYVIEGKYVLTQNRNRFLVLVKTKHQDKLATFETKMTTIGELVNIKEMYVNE